MMYNVNAVSAITKSKQDNVSVEVALVRYPILDGPSGGEKEHQIQISLWIKMTAIVVFAIVYMGQPFKAVADEYMETALCGWGDVNEVPCQDVRKLKIYTAVPHKGVKSTEKMKELNAQVAEWVKNNKSIIEEKKLETELSNLWAKHYFPPSTKKEEASIAVFMYQNNTKLVTLVFISQTMGSVQVLSYDCDSENYKNCMSPLIEKGMRELLKYLIYKN